MFFRNPAPIILSNDACPLVSFTCAVCLTVELPAASSFALCIHPAAASDAAFEGFFGCPGKGGNLVNFDFSDALVSFVDDFDFTGEGFGAGLLSGGVVFAACLLSTAEGFEGGWTVDCLTSALNFSASAVCFSCASRDDFRAFFNSSCSFLAISINLRHESK